MSSWFGSVDERSVVTSISHIVPVAPNAIASKPQNHGTEPDPAVPISKSLDAHLSQFVRIVHTIYPKINTRALIERVLLTEIGRRNITKEVIPSTKASRADKIVARRLRSILMNSVRRTRILTFLSQKNVSKRMLNFFVVHYTLLYNDLTYFLDRSVYPYRIVAGDEDISRDAVFINLHQEYKVMKTNRVMRNVHSPYARSVAIDDPLFTMAEHTYSLSELSFAVWLDNVGGIDTFYRLEQDVRAKKRQFDNDKRHLRTTRKRKKIQIQHTNGKNYSTRVYACAAGAPYIPVAPVHKSWSIVKKHRFGNAAASR